MNMLVVRHGEDTDNKEGILNGHRDTELTARGRRQAHVLGKKLADDCVDLIYTSPLTRAKQTADIIAEHIDVDSIIKEPDLIERDFGILTGKSVHKIETYADETLETEEITYFLEGQGVESFPQAYTRAHKLLEVLEDRYGDDTILLVTHGDIGQMIQAAHHGWSWEKGLKETPYFGNADVLHLQDDQDYFA